MTEHGGRWIPDWAVAPGEVLTEALDERQMTQAELARRMARPLKTISEVATGKAAVTPETAIQLELALGISASTWNGLEARYREALARQKARSEVASHVDWAKRFPVADLVRYGELPAADDPVDQAFLLLAYFGVSSPAGWEQHWGQVAARYRMGRSTTISRESVAAWLRWGERETERLELEPYDPRQLRDVLHQVRRLSRQKLLDSAIESAKTLLASAGVALAVLPGLRGAPASGASRWVRGHPLIQLTLRYRSDDQFWYSLFHEAGHLLTGGRRGGVVEEVDIRDSDSPEEHAADEFARNALIPPELLEAFVDQGDLSRTAIRRFAKELGIAPGIVVGRLQHDGKVPWSSLNDLKRHYEEVR